MIVYGSCLSPFVRKTLFFIGEKNLTTQHLPVAPQDQSPEFRASSPMGKIPGFADGAFRLADSTAICHYLERKYPSPSLFPADPEAYGRMMWFEEFNDTVLVAAAGKVFFNLVVKPNLLGQEGDMEAVEKALKDELPPLFDYLEGQTAGPFLVGNALSLADIAIACPFFNLNFTGHPVDAARWPKFAAYVAGTHARPAYAAISDPTPT